MALGFRALSLGEVGEIMHDFWVQTANKDSEGEGCE